MPRKPPPDYRKIGLSRELSACLSAIRMHIEHTGVSPSFREIGVALGNKSKSQAYRMACELETRGHIILERGKQRAISLVDGPRVLRVNVPEEIHEELKVLSYGARCSLEDVLIEAARDGLKAYRDALAETRKVRLRQAIDYGQRLGN